MADFDPRRRLSDDHLSNQTDRMRNFLDRPRTSAHASMGIGDNAGWTGALFIVAIFYAGVTAYSYLSDFWQPVLGIILTAVYLCIAAGVGRSLPQYFNAAVAFLAALLLTVSGWFLVFAIYEFVRFGSDFLAVFERTFSSARLSEFIVVLAAYLAVVLALILMPSVRNRITLFRAVLYSNVLVVLVFIFIIVLVSLL